MDPSQPEADVKSVVSEWESTPAVFEESVLKWRVSKVTQHLNVVKIMSLSWLSSFFNVDHATVAGAPPPAPHDAPAPEDVSSKRSHGIRRQAIAAWDSILRTHPTLPFLPSQEETQRAEQHLNDVLRIYSQLGQISNQFFARATLYDPGIQHAEVFKAGRTVWFMVAFQLILGQDVRLTPSIFGYNMLYPYTDNLVDDPNLSSQEKTRFAKEFRSRLAGEVTEPSLETYVRVLFSLSSSFAVAHF